MKSILIPIALIFITSVCLALNAWGVISLVNSDAPTPIIFIGVLLSVVLQGCVILLAALHMTKGGKKPTQ